MSDTVTWEKPQGKSRPRSSCIGENGPHTRQRNVFAARCSIKKDEAKRRKGQASPPANRVCRHFRAPSSTTTRQPVRDRPGWPTRRMRPDAPSRAHVAHAPRSRILHTCVFRRHCRRFPLGIAAAAMVQSGNEGLGFVCVAISTLFFGSSFVPVKRYETHDGSRDRRGGRRRPFGLG